MTNTLLQAVARKAEGLTADAELLARFVETRDPRAFEEVVRRHGPLVWSVCHRALPNRADAEDAFQAVFLALVRSAPNIRDGRGLPSWLHGAAVRACLKAKRSFARRAARERAAAQPEASQPVGDAAWEALVLAVHEEVQRLPGAERAAFVLCELEGVSQPDAAARLGWPLGSLSGRLCKARQKLLELLAARGIAPAGAVGVGLSAGAAHAVPEHLVSVATSLPAGAGAASSAALALARGLTEGVTMRVKLAVAAGVLVAALGATGGAALLSKADAQPPVPAKTAPGAPPGMGAGVGGPGGIPGAGAPAGIGGQPPARTPGAPPGVGGGAGGGLGGGPGVGGMGGMMGGGFAGIAAPAWEYKFVSFKGDRKDFEVNLVAQGRDGWEFCTSERFGEGNRTETVLVFKKPKGGPVFGGSGMFGGGGGAPGGGGGRGSGGAGGGDAGGGRVPGGPGGNTGGPRPAPGGVGPGGGGLGGLMGGGPGAAADDNQFHVLILKNAAAADLATVLGSVFPNSRFVAETRANALIVIRCDAATLKKVTELVEKLDVVVAKPK